MQFADGQVSVSDGVVRAGEAVFTGGAITGVRIDHARGSVGFRILGLLVVFAALYFVSCGTFVDAARGNNEMKLTGGVGMIGGLLLLAYGFSARRGHAVFVTAGGREIAVGVYPQIEGARAAAGAIQKAANQAS